MIARQWLTVIVLALSVASLSAQSEPDSVSAAAASESIDQGSDSWTELFNLHKYTFRDLTLYWDNDGTIPNFIDDTDRYYTNGNGIELSFDPNLTQAFQSRFAISDQPMNQQRFGVGVALKQRIYTPQSILSSNPPARDHPYAGYLALAFSFQRADDHTHDHFGLDLGLTGHSSGAEGVQNFIHNTFPDEDDPVGWDTQIPGEPTINFAYTRTWKSERANVGGLEMEMLPAVGFDLGTVLIDVRTSMTLRIGKNLPTDFGPASLIGHKDHTVRVSETGIREGTEETKWSIYAYTKLGVDAVAHDIFIDGTVFHSSRSAQREPLVATFSFGLIARYQSFYLGWTQNIQTERFDLQPDSQTWGSIVLGCSFEF